MRTQDQLTNLIHALTASEKKYFKQFISLRGNSKNYEALFDAMMKQEEYDPEELSKKLRKPKKQIADEKNYLQEVLLKALRNFDEAATPENRLANAYLEVQALNRRGMSAMALRLLDKIYPEIIEYEQHGLYIMAFFTRLELMYKEGFASTPGTVPKEEFEQQMELLREVTDYTQLYHDLGPYIMRRSDPEQAGDFLKGSLLTRTLDEVKGYKSKALYLNVQNAMHTLMHGLGGKGLAYAEELITLYETDEKLRKLYIAAMPYAYLRVALSSPFEESARALAALQKARELLDKSAQFFHPHIKIQVEKIVVLQQLVIHSGIKDYALSEKAGRELMHMKVQGEHQGRLMMVYFMYAHALVMNGKPTEANAILHMMFAMPGTQRVDLQLYARILQLIIQIEFGNYDLLPSLIKSTRGWIKKNKLDGAATEHVIKWIMQMAREPNAAARKELMRVMSDDLMADKVRELNVSYANTVNLKYWIDKKLGERRPAS